MEEESKKQLKKNRVRIIGIVLDVILILLLTSALIYFYSQKEEVSLMFKDPCRACEEETGGFCYSRPPSQLQIDTSFGD